MIIKNRTHVSQYTMGTTMEWTQDDFRPVGMKVMNTGV